MFVISVTFAETVAAVEIEAASDAVLEAVAETVAAVLAAAPTW